MNPGGLSALTKPEVKFASCNGIQVAYQVFGKGPVTLVLTPWSMSHLDYCWSEPGYRRFLESLGSFAKVAVFDKRGTGLSDRKAAPPSLEERVDEIIAVMDAAGLKDAVLVGASAGAPSAILFAATHPSRTRGLALIGPAARGKRSRDYPWAPTEEQYEASFRWAKKSWGSREWEDRAVLVLAPSRAGDAVFTRWLSEMRRAGASQETNMALARFDMETDVTGILSAVAVPATVISVVGDRSSELGEGKYIADRIPGAHLVELSGVDHMFFADVDLADKVAAELKRFSREAAPGDAPQSPLVILVSTGIVDQAKRAAKAGEARWNAIIERHDALVRDEAQKNGGKEVKGGGGEFLVSFDGPVRGLRFAWAVVHAGKELDIDLRAGACAAQLGTGPSDDATASAQFAAAVRDSAGKGAVMTTSGVKDLANGAPVTFRERGERKLKGTPHKATLYSVERLQ